MEQEVPWSSDLHEVKGPLTVQEPGSYIVRLLCGAKPVALTTLVARCARHPENLEEWIASTAIPGCIDKAWACQNLTKHWYLHESGRLHPEYGERIRDGDVALSISITSVFKDLRNRTGCSDL